MIEWSWERSKITISVIPPGCLDIVSRLPEARLFIASQFMYEQEKARETWECMGFASEANKKTISRSHSLPFPHSSRFPLVSSSLVIIRAHVQRSN